ncbi:14381_t:CDS:1, partial [Gigaspora rosea]
MPFSRQQRRQRGFYVTKACTNCQRKHTKCSGRETCERCALRNLECTFIESGKKRGPKTNDKLPEQIYVLNGSENDFEGTFMLSSIIPNFVQGHTSTLSTLSSPYEYLQRPDNIGKFTLYSNFYEKQEIHAFQEAEPFSYNAHIDTGY